MTALQQAWRPAVDRLALSQTGKLGLGLAGVALLLGLYGGRTTVTEDVGGYGIVSGLPPVYWVSVAIATVATVVLFRVAIAERTRYAAAVPALWLGILHTAIHLAHDHFRFQTAWTHIGFTRYIEENNAGEVLIDARFAWPGFFGVFSASLPNVNDTTLELAMRLWPTMLLGGTAILISALATRSYPTVPLIGPLSATVYIMLAWTGQDYFSPQSFGFTVYLSILVLLESGPLRASPAWSASVPFLARFSAAGGDRPAARSPVVFVSLVVLAFGAIVSHPLAPFFICTGLIILGLYGRTVAWRLLAMVGFAYVAWFFITAEPWWSTRLADMIDQVGGFFGNTGASSTERVRSSSPERIFVTSVRTWVGVATFATVLATGIAMATERFRHLRPAIPLAPLAGVPSMALALQSYGGEIVFRVVLFTLPAAAILVGRLLAGVRIRAIPYVVPVVILALMPWLMLARFGNEAFELTSAVDREAWLVAYEEAEGDALLVADNSFTPFADQTIGSNRFVEIQARADQAYVEEMRNLAESIGKERILVVYTPTQSQWRFHGRSFPVTFLDDVALWLEENADGEVLYNKDGGWVIAL